MVLCWMASTSTRCGGYFRDPFLKTRGQRGQVREQRVHEVRNGGEFGDVTPCSHSLSITSYQGTVT